MSDIKLYAWQPKGHGEYSFFVTASCEEEAKNLIDKYIAEHIGKDDGLFIDDYAVQRWGTDYYELTVLPVGGVITNCND